RVPRSDELGPVRCRDCGDPLACKRDLARVLGGLDFASKQAKALIEEMRVEHVRLAVAADFVELARADRAVDGAAVHSQLSRKSAQARHRGKTGARARL